MTLKLVGLYMQPLQTQGELVAALPLPPSPPKEKPLKIKVFPLLKAPLNVMS